MKLPCSAPKGSQRASCCTRRRCCNVMRSEEFVLRKAVTADVPAIVDLINRAFAVEKFFKTGERIDATGLTEMMQHGEFLLLESGAGLIACVFVKITGERAYAGTLAVHP